MQVEADPASGPEPPQSGDTAALDPAQELLLRSADEGRRSGKSQAPLRVEFLFSFQCGHCAEQHAPTLSTLQALCAQGEVELVWRLSFAPQDRDSRRLAMAAFAAAARGEFRSFTSEAFRAARRPAQSGSLRRSPASRIVGHLEQQEGLREYFELLASDPDPFQELAQRETEWVRTMPLRGELPQVLLLESATGQVLGQWQGEDYEPVVLRSAIRAELERRRDPE